jgi:hypothetical protein
MIHGQVAGDVIALLEVGACVGFDHLAVHNLVAAVVAVLLKCKFAILRIMGKGVQEFRIGLKGILG